MTGFRKINHFVTFDTSNIYVRNTAFHSRNQHYSELSFSLYNKLPEILGNILIGACILLWQQGKVLGSIYLQLFKHTILNSTSLAGCGIWCPTDLQHFCCKTLINKKLINKYFMRDKVVDFPKSGHKLLLCIHSNTVLIV